MTHAIFLADEIAARGRSVLQAVVADDDVTAHAASEIHDHIDFAFSNAFDHFTVVACFHAEHAGFRLADVNVDDGGSRLRRRDGSGGDLFRGDCAMWALGNLGVIAGDGARNDDVVIHGDPPSFEMNGTEWVLLYS